MCSLALSLLTVLQTKPPVFEFFSPVFLPIASASTACQRFSRSRNILIQLLSCRLSRMTVEMTQCAAIPSTNPFCFVTQSPIFLKSSISATFAYNLFLYLSPFSNYLLHVPITYFCVFYVFYDPHTLPGVSQSDFVSFLYLIPPALLPP